MATFYKGDCVDTPLGTGRVAYQRLKFRSASDGFVADEAEAVSVVLDSRLGDPNYSGTIFPADKVSTGNPIDFLGRSSNKFPTKL